MLMKVIAVVVTALLLATVAYEQICERRLEQQVRQMESTGKIEVVEARPEIDSTHHFTDAGRDRHVRSLGWRTFFGSTVYLAEIDLDTKRIVGVTRIATHGPIAWAYSLICIGAVVGVFTVCYVMSRRW
jgi:hypothetical protein